MASKLAKKKAADKKVAEETQVVEEAVVDEVADSVDGDACDCNCALSAAVINAFDFSYEVKTTGKALVGMSAQDVMAFISATLGKVDKIIITKK